MDVLDPSFPLLVRTARAMLGWSQSELAKRAGVSTPFVSNLERLESIGRPPYLQKIVSAFENAGVELRGEEGEFGISVKGPLARELREATRRTQLQAQTPSETNAFLKDVSSE